MNLRIFKLFFIVLAAMLFCGCRTMEENNYRIETIDSDGIEAQKVLSAALIDAVRSGDFAAARPLLADGAATEKQFADFCKRFAEAGTVTGCDFLIALAQPPFVKLIYKIEFAKDAKDADGNPVSVKIETLFGILIGNINGKLVVLMFAPVA